MGLFQLVAKLCCSPTMKANEQLVALNLKFRALPSTFFGGARSNHLWTRGLSDQLGSQ